MRGGRDLQGVVPKDVGQPGAEYPQKTHPQPALHRELANLGRARPQQKLNCGQGPANAHHVKHHSRRGVALQAVAREHGKDRPVGCAEQDQPVAGGAKLPGRQRAQVATRHHQQHPGGGQRNPRHGRAGQRLFERQPAEQGHKDGGGGDDPASGGRLGGDQPRGLQPLVEGDADQPQQRKVAPFASGRECQLPPGRHHSPQNRHANGKAQPDHGDRGDIAQGDLGGDKGSPPDGHGKGGFAQCDQPAVGHAGGTASSAARQEATPAVNACGSSCGCSCSRKVCSGRI